MKSLLKKRLPGILAAGLVTLAVGAAGVAPAAASDASVSGLTAAQKKAKAKALKACKKKRTAAKRKACVKAVNRRYAKLGAKGKTTTVLVQSNYYSPAQVNLKVNDSIKWDWKYANGAEPHNVSLFQGPAGVSALSFESQLSTGPDYTFTRKFAKPGDYKFVCSLHTLMTMDVKVSR